MAYIEIPDVVLERAEEFNRLCRENPRSIPSDDYADFCGINKSVFRTLVERGECPFGFGKQAGPYGRGFARLPMLAAYNWHTCGALYLSINNVNWREMMRSG